MSRDPFVSICCLTYNHAPFLHKCLDGFLMQQADFALEVLVHDDASTDGTAAIINEYAARHPAVIKPILQAQNQYSRGRGFVGLKLMFEQARGKYIAYCEGDDYWTDPHKLRKQTAFLESHPAYVITYHNARTVDEHGNPFRCNGRDTDDVIKPSSRADFSREELKTGEQAIGTLTICFRNVFKTTPFPEELHAVPNADLALFSFLGNFGCGKYLGNEIEPAGNRIHSGGVWSLKNRRERLHMLAATYRQLARFYARAGDREASYHFREKEYATLQGLLAEIVKTGSRKELSASYPPYARLAVRRLAGALLLNLRVLRHLALGAKG